MNKEDIAKLQKLYEFTDQGSNCASDEYSRAAFQLMKQRIEILFLEYFEVVKDKELKFCE
jgi:hypothetical protein